MQRFGDHAQGRRKAADSLASFHREDSGAADPIVSPKPQPGGKGRNGGEPLGV